MSGVVLVMMILSIVSFCMFMTTTIVMYYKSQQSLAEFEEVLSFMEQPVLLIVNTLKIIKSTTFNYLVKYCFSDLFDDEIRMREGEKGREEAYSSLDDYRQIYEQFNRRASDKIISYLGSHFISFSTFTFGMMSQEEADQAGHIKDIFTSNQLNLNILNAISIYYSNMYRFIISYDKYLSDALGGIANVFTNEMNAHFIWHNLISFNQSITEFSSFVLNNTIYHFDVLEKFQQQLILIVCGVCCISILSVIPLYAYKQNSQEAILKLVGSFPPNLLIRHVQHIEQALAIIQQSKYSNKINNHFLNEPHRQKDGKQTISNHMKQMKKYQMKQKQQSENKQMSQQIQFIELKSTTQLEGISLNQLPISSVELKELKTKSNEEQLEYQLTYIQRNCNKRSRQIASFRSQRKYSFGILVFALLAICVSMIQPILTVVLTQKFNAEQQNLISEESIILSTLVQLLQNQASNYALFDFISRGEVAKNTIYFSYLSEIRKQNEVQISNLTSLVNRFEERRRDKNAFEMFYKQIMNNNICKYTHYFKQNNFTQQQCECLGDGILTRGFILSTKYAFDIWNNFFYIYEKYISEDEYDPYYWVGGFAKLIELITENDNKLFEINSLNIVLVESIEAILNYQNNIQSDYMECIQSTYDYLFIAQLIIIILLFSLGWTTLFSLFNTQLIQAKSILTLFHISLLIENSFITKYFKENDFGID